MTCMTNAHDLAMMYAAMVKVTMVTANLHFSLSIITDSLAKSSTL